jgi:ABC-type uncharacterized transport system ATPase subunit
MVRTFNAALLGLSNLNSLCGRVPVTKLGRLVKDGKIKSIEEIYLFSLPVKEFQIIDLLLPKLKGAKISLETTRTKND